MEAKNTTPSIIPSLVPVRQKKSKAALVFVHGFQGHAELTWASIVEKVKEEECLDGWDIFLYGYSSKLGIDVPYMWAADGSLATLSHGLQTALESNPLAKYAAVALIAHSMGGLIVQKALVDKKQIDNISLVMLFGTPSDGLVKASVVRWFKRQAKDMARGSAFLSQLRQDWQKRFGTDPGGSGNLSFRFYAVAGEEDEFVPATSSLKPFDPEYRRMVSGNHLQMIRLEPSGTSRAYNFLIHALTEDSMPAGPLESARVAVQLREFRRAIKLFGPHPEELDPSAIVQYALALEGVGQHDEAIQVLRRAGKSSTDAMGALGGRLKRLWRLERKATDGREALRLYKEAYEMAEAESEQDHGQLYYHAINIAYLALVFEGKASRACEWAQRALEHCSAASTPSADSLWRIATEAEAQLILGDHETAYMKYQHYLSLSPRPWQARSTFDQALDICDRQHKWASRDRLEMALASGGLSMAVS